MGLGIIYLVENLVNGKVYIGQTCQKLNVRRNQHNCRARKGCKKALHCAIRKYGEANFHWSILEILDASLLNESEIFWIAYNKFFKLANYNSTLGGEGTRGYKKTPQQIERHAQALRGFKWTIEQREKFRELMIKNHYTFLSPNNEIITIKHMPKFCHQHGLNQGHMYQVAKGKLKQHKGWRLCV